MAVENRMDKKIKNIIRNYIKSFEEKNEKKVLSYFNDDAIWIAPQYKFMGKKEIRGYVLWLFENIKDLTFIDDGIGIMVNGNEAVYQHIFKATIKDVKIKIPSMFIFKFTGNKFCNQRIMSNWFELTKEIPVKVTIDKIGSIMHMGWNRDYSNL